MSVDIRTRAGETISISGGEWSSSDASILSRLETITPLDVGDYTPDVDYTLAQIALQLFGGEIVRYDGPLGEGDPPGTVY